MLQQYHRQTTIKPFAPKFKDRCSKRWDSDVSILTNISLLSVSNASKISDEDLHDILNSQLSEYEDSPASSRANSPNKFKDDSQIHQEKQSKLDPYIFDKHLHGFSSTHSNLIETDIDPSVDDLFNSQSSSQLTFNECSARSIRPPPFSEHIKQIKSKVNVQPSARITNLKLTQEQKLPTRHSVISSMKTVKTLQTNNMHGFQQALKTTTPLLLSSLLIKQMRDDIKNNRAPAYSKPLHSALLREQPHPPFNYRYKMKRVRHWLENLIPTDYIDFNEFASNETTVGTDFNDKLDDECDLLSDEKRDDDHERTYTEAHQHLPLFKSEINRKMRHHDLLLTRLELDLYVI